MKILTIRPTEKILALFDQIKVIDPSPATDRNSIFNRSIELAETKISDKSILDWRSISHYNVKEEGEERSFSNLKLTINSEQAYSNVSNSIRDFFTVKRVTGPFFAKLVLTLYLMSLQEKENEIENSDVLNVARDMITNIGIDCLVFKKAYDNEYNDILSKKEKEELYLLSRHYLENIDRDLNTAIRSQIDSKIQAYSDYFDRFKYNPIKRSNFGCVNIIFVAKVLAGLFLTLIEISNADPQAFIKKLREELK